MQHRLIRIPGTQFCCPMSSIKYIEPSERNKPGANGEKETIVVVQFHSMPDEELVQIFPADIENEEDVELTPESFARHINRQLARGMDFEDLQAGPTDYKYPDDGGAG